MFAAPPSSGRPSRESDASVAVVGPGVGHSVPAPDVDPFVALVGALRAASADPATRVILLEGLSGTITPAHRLDTEGLRTRLGALTALTRVLPGLPQPVVGVAAGPVEDHGCLLAAGCDLVVADPDATFGLLSARDGVPPAVPTLALSAHVGRRAAVAMATAAAPVTAVRALDLGLVTHLAPAGGLDGAVAELLASLTALDPTVVALGRSVGPDAPHDGEAYEAAIEATLCAREMLTDSGPHWFDGPEPPPTTGVPTARGGHRTESTGRTHERR